MKARFIRNRASKETNDVEMFEAFEKKSKKTAREDLLFPEIQKLKGEITGMKNKIGTGSFTGMGNIHHFKKLAERLIIHSEETNTEDEVLEFLRNSVESTINTVADFEWLMLLCQPEGDFNFLRITPNIRNLVSNSTGVPIEDLPEDKTEFYAFVLEKFESGGDYYNIKIKGDKLYWEGFPGPHGAESLYVYSNNEILRTQDMTAHGGGMPYPYTEHYLANVPNEEDFVIAMSYSGEHNYFEEFDRLDESMKAQFVYEAFEKRSKEDARENLLFPEIAEIRRNLNDFSWWTENLKKEKGYDMYDMWKRWEDHVESGNAEQNWNDKIDVIKQPGNEYLIKDKVNDVFYYAHASQTGCLFWDKEWKGWAPGKGSGWKWNKKYIQFWKWNVFENWMDAPIVWLSSRSNDPENDIYLLFYPHTGVFQNWITRPTPELVQQMEAMSGFNENKIEDEDEDEVEEAINLAAMEKGIKVIAKDKDKFKKVL